MTSFNNPPYPDLLLYDDEKGFYISNTASENERRSLEDWLEEYNESESLNPIPDPE